MIVSELIAANEDVSLVAPDIDRDASLSVEWYSDEWGARTLQSMGLSDNDIKQPTIASEETRISELIEAKDRVVWMIRYQEDIVGSLVVSLVSSRYLDAPALTVVIGDTAVRGRGVATMALRLAIDWLQYEQEQPFIFSRYRASNEAALQLLLKVGFEDDGAPYKDDDSIVWQNMILRSDA